MDDPGTERLRILVADDEKVGVDQYRNILSFFSFFEISLCHQGTEAVGAVRAALEENRPFAMVFLDLQMSPEPDAIRVAEHIRQLDPFVEIVIITACPDISPEDLIRRVPPADKLLYLQKPFDVAEIRQIALAMGAKWRKEKASRAERERLERELRKAKAALKLESARHQAAKRTLAKGRRIFFSFMRYQPAMIFIKDGEGKYVYVNRAYERNFGIRAADRIGRTDEDIWPPRIAERLKARDREAMSEGKAVNSVEALTVGEETQYHLISRFPIMRDARPFALGAVGMNISNRMRGGRFRGLSPDPDPIPETEGDEKESPPMTRDIPPPPPGLEIGEALKRLGNSWELYTDLLISFCEDKKNFCDEFPEFVAEGDFEAALVKAHALKGSAATISATRVRDHAKRLEDACMSEDEGRIGPLLEEIGRELEQVFAFRKKIANPPGTGSGNGRVCQPALSKEQSALSEELFRLLDALGRSLGDSDPLSSEEHLDHIGRHVFGRGFDMETENLFEELARNTARYDFEEAGQILRKLVAKLETESGNRKAET